MPVRALPPPTNQQRGNINHQSLQPDQTRRRRNNHGDDSGSDSDDTGCKGGRDHEMAAFAKQQQAQSNPGDSTGHMAGPSRALLDKDELERLEEIRTLPKAAARLDNTRWRRHEGPFRRQALLRWFTPIIDEPMDFEWVSKMQGTIRQQNEEIRYYKEKAVHEDSGDLSHARHYQEAKAIDFLPEVIERVEWEVIHRCRKFDVWHWKANPDDYGDTSTRIIDIMVRIEEDLGPIFEKSHPSEAELAEVGKYLNETCPSFEGGFAVDCLVDAYITRIAQGLALKNLNNSDSSHITKPSIFQIVKERNDQGTLNPSYVAWVCSGVDAEVIKRCCVEWVQDLQEATCQSFQETMESIKTDRRRDFCQDILQPGVVSLVCFKNGSPAMIKEVNPYDLRRLGWFTGARGPRGHVWYADPGGKQYWRYESHLDRDSNKSAIFRVSMDGQVTGLQFGVGRYLEWDPFIERNLAGRRDAASRKSS